MDASQPKGLTTAEAASQRQRFGANRLGEEKDETLLEEILESLREPLVLMLLAVGVLYVLFGEYRDAAIVFGVILTVAVTEASIEYRAGRAVKALSAMAAPTVVVWRDGRATELRSEDLVPGDLIELRAGSRVPADVTLVTSEDVLSDESLITGESLPVERSHEAPDRADLPAGALVVRGSARATIRRTGESSTLGRMVALVGQTKAPKTPLQRRMAELARTLLFAAIAVSIFIPLIGLATGRPWREMLFTALSLAFATIPEELPVLIVVVLGLGSLRLARDGAIVKQIRAAETLGSVTRICTDKTGTLTENRMRVAAALTAADVLAGRLTGRDRLVLDHASLASEHGDAGTALADPMDVAIVASENDLPSPTRFFPFDGDRRIATGIGRVGEQTIFAVKGAPEAVLALCTCWRRETEIRELDGETRKRLLQASADFGAGGRVLAVASRDRGDVSSPRERLGDDLCFDGIVVLADPVRPEVRDAVRVLRDAGVKINIVTGDQPTTALAVAMAIGLSDPRVVLGDALSKGLFPDATRDGELVLARATPAQKLALVEYFNGRGDVVLVTGDGANDGPALKAAAVGVAMGRAGSDVARESADVVLTNDSFATLARAVRDGRGLYDNFRKAIRFYLAIKLALILVTATAAIAGLSLPFSPVQIVILELFMDLGAALSFINLPTDADVMQRPPRAPSASFFDRPMIGYIAAGSLLLAALVFGSFMVGLETGSVASARGYAILAWMLGHVSLGVAMGGGRQFWLNLPLLAWASVSVLFGGLVAFVPAVANALGTQTLPFDHVLVLAPISLLVPLPLLLTTFTGRGPGALRAVEG